MATKKLYCRCNALLLNKDVKFPWDKALQLGARATSSICPVCFFNRWTFPSALAVKNWYKEVRQNPYLLMEEVK